MQLISKTDNRPYMNVIFGNFYSPAFDNEEFVDKTMGLIRDLGFNSVMFDTKAWEDFKERFETGNWTDKDWLDNDYFRTLRKYIDACYKGEIKDEVLEPYKFALKGKFTIYQAEPFIAGGLFIYFIFLDVPNKIFNTWIYSYVDENTETVVDYQVRGVKIIEEDSEFTKEEIVSIIEEHPENKLW